MSRASKLQAHVALILRRVSIEVEQRPCRKFAAATKIA